MKKIPLTNGYFALVDNHWFDYLNQFSWRARVAPHGVYAVRSDGHHGTIFMQWAILPRRFGLLIDHKNRNTLDNRRRNLRYATATQSQGNTGRKRVTPTSKYKGVTWNKQKQKWLCRIGHNWKMLFLGWFYKEEQAAKAYNRAAKHLFGKFACLNKL